MHIPDVGVEGMVPERRTTFQESVSSFLFHRCPSCCIVLLKAVILFLLYFWKGKLGTDSQRIISPGSES